MNDSTSNILLQVKSEMSENFMNMHEKINTVDKTVTRLEAVQFLQGQTLCEVKNDLKKHLIDTGTKIKKPDEITINSNVKIYFVIGTIIAGIIIGLINFFDFV